MARKKQNIVEKDSITCVINNDLKITLKNVTETYGHDDSLPFRADIYVQSNELGFPEPTKIGRAWNDGWGGDSVIESDSHLGIIRYLDGYLISHYQIHIKKPEISWAVHLDYLVSIMAELNIYRKLTHVDILALEYCEEVVPEPEMPKVDQKYNYAECLVQKPLDTEVVTIALSTRGSLGIEKGSALDKKIFHYCDGYEEFLTLLVKEPIFTSPEDFSIKSVNKLY